MHYIVRGKRYVLLSDIPMEIDGELITADDVTARYEYTPELSRE